MSTAEIPEGGRPDGVDENGEIVGPISYPDHIRLNNEPMDEAEAKQITRRIKTYGVRMCQEIVRAYDGSAHKALGCKTWEDYCAEHLGISRQRAHQVIEAARKTSNLALMVECSPDLLVMPERWLRGVTNEELAEVASTAVDAIDPDATDDERAAAVVGQVEKLHRTTHRRSDSVTHEFSSGQDPAPGADESGGEAKPDLPAAESPEAGVETGDGDGADEPDEAAPPADGSDASDGGVSSSGTPVADSPASSGAGPDATPEPVASGPEELRAQASRAVAAVRKSGLLSIDAADAAEVVRVEDFDDRRTFCEEVITWAHTHLDVLEMHKGPRGIK